MNNQDIYNNSKDINILLNKDEKKKLNTLNKKSNKINQIKQLESDFMNKSLREIYINWGKVNMSIIEDLVTFSNEINNYSKFFNDLDDSTNILTGIISILKDIYDIFTKNDRGIYVGITFIIFSILYYMIGISS